jgi:peptidoglycan/LPS O-acetylase OafA/YrhL
LKTLTPKVEQPVSTAGLQRISSERVDPSPSGSRRVPELDGIRGVAIALVLIRHSFETSAATGIMGAMGVDLFFVLSGYLITGILLAAKSRPHYFRNFYARRALRIFPLYYLLLILIAVSYPHPGPYVVLGLFYVSNLWHLFAVPMLYAPLWSLSVEEHFYFVWPWVVRRLNVTRLRNLALAVVVIEPLFRGLAYYHHWPIYCYTWFRLDGLALGAFLACDVRMKGRSPHRLAISSALALAASAALLTLMPLFAAGSMAVFFSFNSILSVALIAATLSGQIPTLSAIMRSRALVKTGELSYFLYIAHELIFHFWDSLLGAGQPLLLHWLGAFGALMIRDTVVLAVTFLLAELSRRYFEGPILALKRHFPSVVPTAVSVGQMRPASQQA